MLLIRQLEEVDDDLTTTALFYYVIGSMVKNTNINMTLRTFKPKKLQDFLTK